MKEQSRRRFIRNILAASVCAAGLGNVPKATTCLSNEALSELSVIARQPGTLATATIDVWTGQIGSLDFSQLPQHFGRVVVWDDVRGNRALSREITRILFAIEQQFGIKPKLGSNASAHLEHAGELSVSIDKVLDTFTPSHHDATCRRIAIIDLSSCGLTRLRWLDILPSLHRSYTHVIGIEFSVPDLCELDPSFQPPYGLTDVARETMQACDFWLLASDNPICGRGDLSIEERSLEFTQSIAALCDRIAVQTDIATAIGSITSRHFTTFGVRS